MIFVNTRIIWFLLFFVAITGVPERPAHYENLLQITKESLENCYEDAANTIKVEMTDAGFQALLEASREPPRNGKCLRYCIMRRNNLFNEQNQLDSNAVLQFFAKLHGDRVDAEALQNVVAHCKEEAVKETDSCERAHVSAMCLLSHLEERGYGIL